MANKVKWRRVGSERRGHEKEDRRVERGKPTNKNTYELGVEERSRLVQGTPEKIPS